MTDREKLEYVRERIESDIRTVLDRLQQMRGVEGLEIAVIMIEDHASDLSALLALVVEK